MRIFIAIVLPGDLCKEIDGLKGKLDLEGVKTTVDSHITLKFLGDVNEGDLIGLKKRLSEIRFSKFDLTLGGTKFVPSEQFFDRVHIEFKEDSGLDSLHKLHLQIKIATKGVGTERDERGFLPHVTLARVKFVKDKPKFVSEVKKINLKGRSFAVDEFYLIQSVLTDKGPEYTMLGRYGGRE